MVRTKTFLEMWDNIDKKVELFVSKLPKYTEVLDMRLSAAQPAGFVYLVVIYRLPED